MQSLFRVAATAAAVALAAGPATAAHFSPDHVSFSGVGPFGVVQGQVGGACTMTIQGHVKKKTGKITSAVFSACSGGGTVTATGLPWPIKISDVDGEVSISNFGFAGLGTFCGPGVLGVSVTSTWSYNTPGFPPNCLLNGNWTLTPPITIFKPK